MVAAEIDPKRLVFVDECGTNIGLVPLHARAPKGERAFTKAPRNRGKNITLLASLSLEGIGPCVAVEGSTTRAVFEAYVEQVLAPTLKKGHIVVLDNLSAHKGTRCVSWSKRGARACCSCHPIRQISRPSRKPSRR